MKYLNNYIEPQRVESESIFNDIGDQYLDVMKNIIIHTTCEEETINFKIRELLYSEPKFDFDADCVYISGILNELLCSKNDETRFQILKRTGWLSKNIINLLLLLLAQKEEAAIEYLWESDIHRNNLVNEADRLLGDVVIQRLDTRKCISVLLNMLFSKIIHLEERIANLEGKPYPSMYSSELAISILREYQPDLFNNQSSKDIGEKKQPDTSYRSD